MHVLREFVGTNTVRPTPEQRAQLIEFDARVFQAGLSLCELAELTDRTETAIRTLSTTPEFTCRLHPPMNDSRKPAWSG